MEQLKVLIELVAGLPSLTVWVLVGFLLYKIVVVGSIYSVARLLIIKLHHAITRSKEFTIDEVPVNAETAVALTKQLSRLLGGGFFYKMQDVEKLRKALDNAGIEP